MQFRVLGPIEVVAGARTEQVSSDRRRRLLAALVAAEGRPVPYHRLVDAVWADDPPRSARGSLQSHVSRLRAFLADVGGDGERVVTRGDGYALVPTDADSIDARVFTAAVDEASRALDSDPANALQLLDDALTAWRGSPYGGAASAVPGEVRRLEALKARAGALRTEALLGLGRFDRATATAEAVLARDPLDERAAAQLLTALAAAGRRSEAISFHQRFTDRLSEELGVDPSPPLRQRYAEVLRDDGHATASTTPTAPTATTAPTNHPVPAATDAARPPRPPQPPRPAPPTVSTGDLIGRHHAVADVTALLGDHRLVTLTGPGGVGKTRLAMAVAEQAHDDHDDLAVVELAAVDDPASVAAVVASALGVVPGGEAPQDRLVDALRGRRLLLVLDNCEHLLPPVGVLVDHLLRRCADLRVLATSREPLSITAEQRSPVPPLEVPPADATTRAAVAAAPAAALFAERARAADPQFELDERTAPAVARLCRGLDGLPLALELAAARVAALPVEELADRLDDRFELLAPGRHGEDRRHRTLRAVVTWSYDLLGKSEAELFDRLSVFAGGFRLDAAEAVAGVDRQRATVAADLAALVERSMVERHGQRYHLLETLRLHGAERLTERGQQERLGRAHAHHYSAFAEHAGRGIRGPDEHEWVGRIEEELDNLRAAHEWAIGHGAVDLALGIPTSLAMYGDWWLVDEVLRWADTAAELPAAAEHPLLPAALGAAARGAGNRGELDRARELAQRGLAAAPDTGDPRRTLPLRALALAHFYDGRLERSLELEDELAATAAHDPYHSTYVAVMRTLITTYAGDHAAAVAHARSAVDQADRLGNVHLGAIAAYARGEALAQSDPDEALRWVEEAIDRARQVHVALIEAVALVTRSSIRADRGEPAAALRSFRAAIVRLRRGGDWTHQWTTLRNLVFLLVRTGAHQPAAVLVGAIDGARTAARLYGDDADRWRTVTARLRSSLDRDVFDAAHRRGRAMTGPAAVDTALETVERLLRAHT